MTDLPLVPRRHFSVPMVLLGTLVALLCTTLWAGQDAKEPFEVGQRWVYKHEGPRPGSMEPNDINGERIMHVIGVVEGPEGKQWIIEDRFTNDEKAIGRLYINKQRLLTAIEIKNEKGEAAKLRYDPPAPHQVMELNIGQEKTIETSLKMDSAKFTLPSTIVIRRLDDETITTPAGEFVDCRYYQIKTKSIFNIKIAKIPFTEERERWYHPKINGLVKEVYRKGPVKFLTWSREGYTATSVLTAFGKEDVPAEIRTANSLDNTNQSQKSSDQSQPKASRSSAIFAVLLGTTIILVTGIYILRKQSKRNAPTGPTM
ncbi:hypothetical protein ACFL5Z_09075 [Planctomycetota bacterium]